MLTLLIKIDIQYQYTTYRLIDVLEYYLENR